jgi:hypothetical protein
MAQGETVHVTATLVNYQRTETENTLKKSPDAKRPDLMLSYRHVVEVRDVVCAPGSTKTAAQLRTKWGTFNKPVISSLSRKEDDETVPLVGQRFSFELNVKPNESRTGEKKGPDFWVTIWNVAEAPAAREGHEVTAPPPAAAQPRGDNEFMRRGGIINAVASASETLRAFMSFWGCKPEETNLLLKKLQAFAEIGELPFSEQPVETEAHDPMNDQPGDDEF